jgi:hypothetical protein
MMKLTTAALLLALLTLTGGCIDYAHRDDATCQSYGLSFGGEKYATCRMMLTQQRTNTANSMLDRYQRQTEMQQRSNSDLMNALTAPRPQPTNCTYGGGYTHCW